MIQQSAKFVADVAVNETDHILTFSTPQLSIRVNKLTSALTYLDSSEEILTKESDRGGKTLIPTDVYKLFLTKLVRRKYERMQMVCMLLSRPVNRFLPVGPSDKTGI